MFRNERALLLGESNFGNEEYDEFITRMSLGGNPFYEKGTDEGFSAACIQCSDYVSMNGLLEDFLLISARYQTIVAGCGWLCSH